MKVENMLLAMLEEKRKRVNGFHPPFLPILMTLIQMHKNQWLLSNPSMDGGPGSSNCYDGWMYCFFLKKLIFRLEEATYHLQKFLLCFSRWVYKGCLLMSDWPQLVPILLSPWLTTTRKSEVHAYLI